MLVRTNYLSKRYTETDGWKLGPYERDGGYKQAKRALGMKRDDLLTEMRAANIRGRGGAGFPMGVKWGFMPWPPKPEKPHYLVINADEGEPGTFKDRTIMELNPHAVVEGCIIGCFGIGAHAAYICGEETSLLNALEGKRGEPRLKPPFPAQAGAFGMPSTVNNLETIAVVPTALEMGGEAFSKLSAIHDLKDGGTRLFGVSGHVKTPGVFEAAVGLTLRELVYDLGGGVEHGELLGVIPGGSSCPILRPEETVNAPDAKHVLHPWHGKSVLDVPMGVDTYRALGTMLGTCCAIVLSDKADPVLAFQNLMQFYRHESCGQCTPCREGSAWLNRILTRVVDGKAEMEELDRLHEIANNIMGNTICAFGEGTAMPAMGFIKKFRKELEAYVSSGGKAGTGTLAPDYFPPRGGAAKPAMSKTVPASPLTRR